MYKDAQISIQNFPYRDFRFSISILDFHCNHYNPYLSGGGRDRDSLRGRRRRRFRRLVFNLYCWRNDLECEVGDDGNFWKFTVSHCVLCEIPENEEIET